MSICPTCGGALAVDAAHACSSREAAAAAPSLHSGGRAAADAPSDPLVGKVLGEYRVLEKIGEGGMGAVYVVEHARLKKRFAAKVLAGAWADRPVAMKRLELEALSASKLDHDNIVSVVNFGRSDEGIVFLVMELLRGETLREVIARGPLAIEDAVRVAAQICRALGAAHGAAIVHRDLKPENVFIAQRSGGRSTVKLLDFGISRDTDGDVAASRLTHTGQVLGTPLYMAPESARGASNVDARADLYAVGVILYEMVTGRAPFIDGSAVGIIFLHCFEAPDPPSKLRDDLPPELERVILRALEKDPAARHQTASELEEAMLEAVPIDVDASFGFAAASARGGSSPPSARPTRVASSGPASARPTTRRDDSDAVTGRSFATRSPPSSGATRRVAAPRPPTNLPAQGTRFVGRPREVADVSNLLQGSRLVTLTGTGGAGKTRLAVEIAARLSFEHRDGTWLVDLAALNDGALLADAVAHALGFEVRNAADAVGSLAAALAEKQMLVVLDNCEHLVADCARLMEALVRGCPGIQLIATSREPLGVAGETTYRVPPLSMPDASRVRAPIDLQAFDSVQLFVDRARAASPGFEITEANARAVAEVCVQLDGLPLALELAAARVRNLSVEEIRARLGDRFRLLTGGGRTALPRQKTLRALVDWSHELLDDRQRLVWRRLAVFSGGFALAQAEAVVSGGGIEPSEVLDVVSELVDRSILVAETRGPATRYRLLETLRQYGRERLEAAGEAEAFSRRHCDELLRWVEALASTYAGSRDDAEWFDRIAVDHDNLREAIRESLAPSNGVAPAELVSHRFAVALRRFWMVRGYYTEAVTFLRAMLARYAEPSAARLDLLEGANAFAALQHDYGAALAYVVEGLALAETLHEHARESVLRTHRAYIHFLQSAFAEADRLAAEALPFARARAGGFALVFALNVAGLIAGRVGDHGRSVALLEECRAITLTSGGRQYHGNVLESLGTAYALRDGNYERALPLFRECTVLLSAVGDQQGELAMCERMAEVAASRGQEAIAARLLASADRVREHLGAPREPVYAADLAPAIAAIEARLGPEERAAARAEGRALAFAGAVALALTVE